MGYVFLTMGLVLGIAGQMCVKLSKGLRQTVPTIGAFLLFIACIYFISLTTHYFEIGIVFAIWAGLTIVSTTLLGIYIFKESKNKRKIISVTLIITGVIILKAF
ncbi:QacE family quaternary ammonium compound efflux SMR transporter [Priestia megaterium]|jgi:small multidrug resistance pump|uniref:Small Multidrug Resistance family protein n=1 Tax=Priestia megaterium (strain ATCC 14581 / DSM 32 / CCUG 1817 / JCM 2506 / NBRC 15308 / NCIMB 9376 / NCTC 10342 / NRRL B-14308 / VKM B-512 / Ford 19) TaxID=1348623 RepID=A0A0B6AL80_PRIM2|nr:MULTISPECIES: SMR family transporter [Priestia]HWL24270.1 SMR family transporter [Ureibacillus sp.]AJI20559.1 small Multidrug Resistance family protein [Priestia megaterium NBRC 15308 = ATCC 14581]KFM96987.1 small Multidrug Resistance family protein [Priestia megaterium]KGJ78428.1 membrane protein [Priestia megaterium NBRC 15308 = ATCC 14581]MBU8753788.1 QacE family quaternary ammonium compound efflux SMR transporter [Priestia megaterium]